MSSDVSEVYERQRHQERQRKWWRVFNDVIEGYRDVLSASPLVACNPDDEVRVRRLGPDLIHYKIDIENATRRVLKDSTLLRAWEQIVEGHTVPRPVFALVASKCGRIYTSRKLTRYDYFTSVKRGRRRGISTGVAA
jgi:hypothetical protein